MFITVPPNEDDTNSLAVNGVTYHGTDISDSRNAFLARRKLAWAAASKLYKVFLSPISESLKVRLFQATVESVLLYDCETLTITKTLAKEIGGAPSSLLRYALNIRWPQKIKRSTSKFVRMLSNHPEPETEAVWPTNEGKKLCSRSYPPNPIDSKIPCWRT